MNEIRARYIQDEREDARKEGIKEGEIKGIKKGKIEGKMEERKQVITNMLNETDDINFIQKMTKYPRSEIINVAKLASINIKI
jgi:flagellar biosynthesis/type III secretory pathway protein FliH